MGVEITNSNNGIPLRPHDYKASEQVRCLATDGYRKYIEFAIIHWRAEIPNMNYMECAERIVNAKDTMLLFSPNARFLLMLS
jgi:hypothetical protein